MKQLLTYPILKKKYWLIPLYFLLFLFSLMSINAVTNNAQLYYSFDLENTTGTTMIDISNNGTDGTCSGMGGDCNTVIGKLINASGFNGVGEYITSTALPYVSKSSAWTFSGWIYTDTIAAGTRTVWQSNPIGGSVDLNGLQLNGNILTTAIYNGASYFVQKQTTISANTWYYVTITFDGVNTLKLYVDNVEKTSTGTNPQLDVNVELAIGSRTNTHLALWDGKLDEFAFYNRVISASDRAELFNSGVGFNPYFIAPIFIPVIEFEEIKLNNVTNFNNTFYNTTPQLLEVTLNITNTNNNTNVTFFMYNSTNDLITTNQFITNNLTGSLNISFPYDDTFKFFLNASNNETSTISPDFGNYTINYDISFPIINNSIPSQIDSYQFLDTYFSCSDLNLVSCNISIDGFNKASDLNFTLTHNGNLSYNITAIDLANNTILETGFLFVNPNIYIYAEDFSLNPLTNFTVEGRSDNNTGFVIYSTYNDGLIFGNNTLLFIKVGYANANVTFLLNTTSDLNLTVTTGITLLYLNIFDTNTDQLILQNVDIDLIGELFAGSFVTSTGLITISNISEIPGIYQLILNSNDYAQLIYVFQHTGFSIVNLSIYMQPINDTIPVLYNIEDKLGNRMGSSEEFPKCLVQVSEYDITTNSYILQTMDYTNSNGQVIFDIDTTKNIKNTLICDSGTFIFQGEKITSTPVLLTIGADAIEYFDSQLNLFFTPINYTQVDNTTGRFTIQYADSNGILTLACLNVSQRLFGGDVFIADQCLTTATGSLNIDFNTSEGETFIATAYFIYLDERYSVPSYVKTIPINYEDLGLIGLFFTLLIVFALGLAGLTMPPGAKFLGVMFGGTIGLWIGSVATFIPMSYYALTTWTILLILGAIFS